MSENERGKSLWEKVASFHRSDDATGAGAISNFFIPKLSVGFFVRLGVIALLAIVIFKYLLLPCIIDGGSMIPTYPEKGFVLCWKGAFWFDKPKRGDIVVIKYSDKVYFLKRIIGLPGETVEFINGELYINGKKQDEPYIKYISDWNLSPRVVYDNGYYVVGDNRSQHIDEHKFGQVKASKILGSPIW